MTEVRTDNLILKTLDNTNATDVLNFYKLNKSHFEAWEPDRAKSFYTVNFHQANLSFEANQIQYNKMLRLWIFHKDFPDIIIGTICFDNFQKGAVMSCNLSYKTDRFSCNKGIMTEALTKAIHIIFNVYDFHRIEVSVHPDNAPSIHLLEKFGFVYEGIAKESVLLKGQWCDHLRYALINHS